MMLYTSDYFDLQLFNREQLHNQLTAEQAAPIAIFRDALAQGNVVLKQRFQEKLDVVAFLQQRTWLIDQILTAAWESVVGFPNDAFALVAVGGYGRGELHPASDIDLMLLLETSAETETCANIETFIMFLWDIRLEIGHSVRTLAECQQQAEADITIATTLMESRLITGSDSLFLVMQANLTPTKIWPSKDFFTAKCQEQRERYIKYHGTAYNLEPNVKESPGGLRDIQMVGWVAKWHFGVNTLHELVEQQFLTEQEYETLNKGQLFLWQIRCLLHLEAGRREDRLSFDYQRILANTLGFADDEARLGVEKLMRQYYRMVKEISSLNDMLLQLFREAILYAHQPSQIIPLNKRFQIRNEFIEATHAKVFKHYPFALLEIFLLMQQHKQVQGVRASTIRLIRQHIHLIDGAFHQDLRARSLFFEIIRQPDGVTQAFRCMNAYGVLGQYLPAFGRVVGQMQYDLYHVYTVDQHTLFVVRNIRRYTKAAFQAELPLCSEIMQTCIHKPELLYLAGLFHDIAKGRGGDHSTLGEVDALTFCQAHGLSDHDARFVAWLVRYHLLMSTTAQRQDIYDPNVVKGFAQKVADKMHLDYLYLLTVADIRATNPKLWNGWKDSLLQDLYHKTRRVLFDGLDNPLSRETQIERVQAKALKLLDNEAESARVTRLWQDLGDDYFLRSQPSNIARETLAILTHKQPDIPLVIERESGDNTTAFMIYGLDRAYLFADTVYFLEHQGLTVADAYIVPTETTHTIAGYTVLQEDGQAIADPQRVAEILNGLREALIKPTDLPFCPVRRRVPLQFKHFTVPTRITFSHDRLHNHTIMEVVTTDRPGVLSYLARAFTICDVRVKKAKIATFGSRVEDIFFITDANNKMIHAADQLDCLRENSSRLLNEAITDKNSEAVVQEITI